MKIKQLEWTKQYLHAHRADTPIYNIGYTIENHVNEFDVFLRGSNFSFLQSFNTLELAKQFAQEHFEKIVLDCLEESDLIRLKDRYIGRRAKCTDKRFGKFGSYYTIQDIKISKDGFVMGLINDNWVGHEETYLRSEHFDCENLKAMV